MQATALSLATMAGMVSFNTAFAASGGRVAMTARHDGTVELITPFSHGATTPANDNRTARLVAPKPAKATPVRKVAMDPDQMFAATNREFLPWS